MRNPFIISARWRREEKQRKKNEADAWTPSKTDDEILACIISDAYINKVLILSFVSLSFSPESKTFSLFLRGNVSKHTEELATREREKELLYGSAKGVVKAAERNNVSMSYMFL